MMLSHDTVSNFYLTNFQLVQHHKYTMQDINNMMPWERRVFVDMLLDWLAKEEQRINKK
jgi:hypothetical protein